MGEELNSISDTNANHLLRKEMCFVDQGDARITAFRRRILKSESHFDSRSTLLIVCLTIALSYLAPTLVGMLVSNPQTVWPLWPGCAILVVGLLLVRISLWPVVILASFVGFAVADLRAGVPLSSIAWFIPGNTVEVLVSAIGLRYCFDGPPRLNGVKALAKYFFIAGVLAPFAGAFLSALGVARNYRMGWKIVFLSEVLAFVTLAPALLSWISEGHVLRRRSRAHHLEGMILIAGLVLVCYVVFTLPQDSRSPALFYTLVPFLLWSALRFGWLGVSTSLITVSTLSIWGAVHGRGPFSHMLPLTNPLPLQMFLIFASMTFMVLAAVAEEHEQAAHVVRESEERFRLVANTAPVMIWMFGTDKQCTYVNQPQLEFTGRPLEAELGNGWLENVHPEDLNRCMHTYTQEFDRRESFQIEYRLRRHDGEYRWLSAIGVPRFNPDHSFAGYIGSSTDVTERRLAEESLADVGRRLIEAHEEERTWIARELHDDINQRIALLAIELDRWNQQLPPSAVEFHDRIHHASQRLSDIAKDVQSLSHRLHSSKLEYLGLVTAANSFCEELSEQQKVEIEFSHTAIPRSMPKEISLCLFRVLQETLQNAVKHSGVRHYNVELHGTEGAIQLKVSDLGVGFDPQDAIHLRGLGLISMRERIQLVSGEFFINSHPGSGTTIHARVPLNSGRDSVRAAG
jgi:PAS domain S-box-containing protein